MIGLKIVIVPNHPYPYDQRMVRGLADGLRELGNNPFALTKPVSPDELKTICEESSANVVIQVNKNRDPNVALPDSVRHISWYQDVFLETLDTLESGFRPGDILYTLGDPGVLGLNFEVPCFCGTLSTGVDERAIKYLGGNKEKNIDFALCGYIPPPLDLYSTSQVQHGITLNGFLRRLASKILSPSIKYLLKEMREKNRLTRSIIKKANFTMEKIVRDNYRPLCGGLNIHHLKDLILDSDIFESEEKTHDKALAAELSASLSFFTNTYPRLLDREKLITTALECSDSLELYGPGWDAHKNFRKYWMGNISSENELFEVYRKTRINLTNNTHGIGIHSRVLECMAVGGFIMSHRSTNDCKEGGILTSFQPGEHFAYYSHNSFEEDTAYWLRERNLRNLIGARAAALVRERHLWRNRAQQIIDDLKR